MTRILLAAVLMASAAPTLSQNASADEALIRALNEESGDAQVRRDIAALDRLLADDCILTRAGGATVDKAQNLTELESGDISFASYENDDVRVSLYGDTAVVTGQATTSGAYRDQAFTGRFRYTKVFVKRQDQWRIVAWHATSMPQQ